jgi:hypothetical protein
MAAFICTHSYSYAELLHNKALMERRSKKGIAFNTFRTHSYCLLLNITLVKKKIKFSLIYKEIQSGAVANGFLIYGEIFAHFLIY